MSDANEVGEAVDHRLRERHRATTAQHKHPVNKLHFDQASFGERVADRLAASMGSWGFMIPQTILILAWISFNVFGLFIEHWDPFPFILLNLVLSFQATYAGPIVLLAGNRQGEKDRLTLEHAADETAKNLKTIGTILSEIKKNTELTVNILEMLEAGGA